MVIKILLTCNVMQRLDKSEKNIFIFHSLSCSLVYNIRLTIHLFVTSNHMLEIAFLFHK